MRIPGFLVLFWFGLLMAGAASASAQAQSSSSQPASPSLTANFDLLQQPVPGMAVDQYRLPLRWRDNLGRFAKNMGSAQDEVCYTMRSYKVERAEKFSDGDGVTSYSTCQPSSRFELKQAVEPATDSK